MDLQNIAHVGELIGAAAVVVSLIYVGHQIRQNTISAQAATFQSYVENAMGWMESVYSNAELCELWKKGNEYPRSLDAIEKERYSFLLLAFFRMFENLYLQVQKGFVEPAQWEGLQESYLMLMEAKGLRSWWVENEQRYNKPFRAFIDSELQKRGATAAEPRDEQ